jgi:hypothetical protein
MKKKAKSLKVKQENKLSPKLTIKDGRPILKTTVDGDIIQPDNVTDLPQVIIDSTGIDDNDAALCLILDVARIGNIAQSGLFLDSSESLVNSGLALMHDIKPQSALEGMLTAQIVGTYRASMKMLSNALLPDQTFDGKDANINRATKLQRTFLQQIEALQKLRGKGQQKMTVEHVHVHEGGQAVVGTVNHGGE